MSAVGLGLAAGSGIGAEVPPFERIDTVSGGHKEHAAVAWAVCLKRPMGLVYTAIPRPKVAILQFHTLAVPSNATAERWKTPCSRKRVCPFKMEQHPSFISKGFQMPVPASLL